MPVTILIAAGFMLMFRLPDEPKGRLAGVLNPGSPFATSGLPCRANGRTKLAGEMAVRQLGGLHLILRTG